MLIAFLAMPNVWKLLWNRTSSTFDNSVLAFNAFHSTRHGAICAIYETLHLFKDWIARGIHTTRGNAFDSILNRASPAAYTTL